MGDLRDHASVRKTRTDLGLNLGSTVGSAYLGKVPGEVLTYDKAGAWKEAYKLPKDWKQYLTQSPYLKLEISTSTGEKLINAGKGLDREFTSILLANNALWGTASCYTSLSSPCVG